LDNSKVNKNSGTLPGAVILLKEVKIC
jgi:hypothetical protein